MKNRSWFQGVSTYALSFVLCLQAVAQAFGSSVASPPIQAMPSSATPSAFGTDAPPGMPPPPSSTELDQKRPKCPTYRITRTDRYLMEQCRALWEDYLKINIEGYRQSFGPYVRALNRLEKRLQLKVPKELEMTQYEDYKAIIADEITDSTIKDGRYMRIYFEYIEAYKRQVQILKNHHSLAANQ